LHISASLVAGVLSPANPLYTAHEIANQLRDSQATVVVAHPMCLEAATSALAMLASEGDQRPKRLVVLGEKAPSSEVVPLAAMKGTGRGVASLGAVPSNQLAVIVLTVVLVVGMDTLALNLLILITSIGF